MSETEAKKGRLRIFPRRESESYKEYILRFFEHNNQFFPTDYNSNDSEELRLAFTDYFYRKAVLYKNLIYEILETIDIEESDIFEAEQLADGNIKFLVQFYNGGCSFSEAIVNALDNMKLKEI